MSTGPSDIANALLAAQLAQNGPEPAEEDLVPPPSLEHLFLALPLYSKLKVNDREFLKLFRSQNFQLDSHCVDCQKETVFKTERSYGSGAGQPAPKRNWMYEPGFVLIELVCQRDAAHRSVFDFYFDGENLMKWGQMPSLEDISGVDILPYRKLLPDEYFSELKKANGLASHGIGIGAFVYLRRIFERLVAQHRDDFERSNGPIDDFDTMRMDEKIGALKDVLPIALVENRAAYSILSKGIHELDEDTCKNYFPVVRQAIISILEQDRAQRRQAEEAKKLREQIGKIAGELKKD